MDNCSKGPLKCYVMQWGGDVSFPGNKNSKVYGSTLLACYVTLET